MLSRQAEWAHVSSLVPKTGEAHRSLDTPICATVYCEEMRSRTLTTRSRSSSFASRAQRFALLHWRRAATAVAGVMVVGMGFHVVFGQNGLTAYEHKRQESRALTREAAALTRENEFFRGHVARLESDPGAIEHQAWAYLRGAAALRTDLPQ